MKTHSLSSTLSAVLLACAATSTLLGQAQAQDYNRNSSYANPDGTTTEVYKRRGPCSDPWVTIALIRVYGQAEPSRCNVGLYNGGNWRDYNELVHAVGKVKAQQSAAAPKNPTRIDLTHLTARKLDADSFAITSKNGIQLGTVDSGRLTVSLPPNLVGNDGASLIGNDGSTLVAAGGGNMVAAGGGNMVAAGGGNMVAAGGGNMVAAGGGNLLGAIKDKIERTNPTVSLQGAGYNLQSARNFNDLKQLSKK